jgi:hypothetical protein
MMQKQVRTQQIHEMKKKEKEYIKLQVGYFLNAESLVKIIDIGMRIIMFYFQERLNQVLMEKKKESRSGMEIMNLLQVFVGGQ